ncbi:MAG: phosphoribosylanthranilate isomerase [Cyclobacteriaceae bacterium]|nr:phosphoribosylanthranilate isomerase [Cyclobacteriaceae bacterium]
MKIAPRVWKVCGMRDADNLRAVSKLQPDYMGFIFYDSSPRFVGDSFRIPNDLPTHVKRVGVFVNEDMDRVQQLVQKHQLDFVQLHGDESVAYAQELKSKVGVIKVFRVDADFDFCSTSEYESAADFFLFDTKGKHYGGNAFRFDWNLLGKYTGNTPFFLSGGISESNIQDLEDFHHKMFFGIDINSGVEEQPAIKSVDKIKSLLNSLNKIRP